MKFKLIQLSEKNCESTYVVYKLISLINCILGSMQLCSNLSSVFCPGDSFTQSDIY